MARKTLSFTGKPAGDLAEMMGKAYNRAYEMADNWNKNCPIGTLVVVELTSPTRFMEAVTIDRAKLDFAMVIVRVRNAEGRESTHERLWMKAVEGPIQAHMVIPNEQV